MFALRHAAVPVDIDRDDALEAARRELADPIYRRDDPSLIERIIDRALDELDELLRRATENAPGGILGLVILLVVIVAVVAVIRYTVGPLARTTDAQDPLVTDRAMTADEHRREANRASAEGRWADAIRERLRAILRDLEDRGLIESRAGRTATEAAREAAGPLPGCADDLAMAARIFDDVWYGGRTATSDLDARLRAVDHTVRDTRPVVLR